MGKRNSGRNASGGAAREVKYYYRLPVSQPGGAPGLDRGADGRKSRGGSSQKGVGGGKTRSTT